MLCRKAHKRVPKKSGTRHRQQLVHFACLLGALHKPEYSSCLSRSRLDGTGSDLGSRSHSDVVHLEFLDTITSSLGYDPDDRRGPWHANE